MIFPFPDDIQAIKELLEQRAGFAPELIDACKEHIKHGQYADAVFKAFRVLEGRIQQRGEYHGESASRTINTVLNPRGPLTKKLGLTSEQAAHFRDLLKAGFGLFRNPEAHPQDAVIEYGGAECQAVLAFVNLMLDILDRQPDDPLQAAHKQIGRDIGRGATERLSRFLERVRALDLKMLRRKISFPFRAWSLRVTQKEAPPKKTRTTVFLIRPNAGNPWLAFPVLWQWSSVVGFDYESYVVRLKALGCVETGTEYGLRLDLRDHNASETFEQLYGIVRDIVREMEETLVPQAESK